MYIKELAVFGLSTIEMVHDLSFVQHGTRHAPAAAHLPPHHAAAQARALMQRLWASCRASSSLW
jgi:hypothetical protein